MIFNDKNTNFRVNYYIKKDTPLSYISEIFKDI